MMSHQIENTSKEIDFIKGNQIEILELKSTIIEMKNLLAEPNSRFEQSAERISGLENRSIEIIHFKGQKEKRMKKNE